MGRRHPLAALRAAADGRRGDRQTALRSAARWSAIRRPSRWAGCEEVDWSADGRTVFFALREAGRIEPTSTNLDIFAAPADGSAAPTNLTPDNDGTDNLPTASPDGKWLAYFSMKRPGYEADRQVLMLWRDLATAGRSAR